MSLFSIELSNWRAFRDKVSIAVKPLTLIYGHNQAGKSSLLRALPLLADSIYGNSGPIKTDSAAMAGATFADLGWRRSGYPTWGVSAPDGNDTANILVKFSDADGMIVNHFELYQPSGDGKRDEFLVDWAKTTGRIGGRLTANYVGQHRGQDWEDKLQFSCFFPEGLPPATQAKMAAIQKALAPLEKIQWLQANRVAAAVPGPGKIRCCAEDGSDLAGIMQTRELEQVLRLAAQWCGVQGTIADELIVRQDTSTSLWQFYLQRLNSPELALHLAGEGVRSLLPVLLCACWADISRQQTNLVTPGPSLLAIEEPESHLHPHWQVALFDRLLESVKLGTPVVLETHSVHMLRAMQLAVLQGRMPASDVALYWVEQDTEGVAKLVPVTVKEDASLTGWRPDVFETEQELAHQILDLRWKMGRPST